MLVPSNKVKFYLLSVNSIILTIGYSIFLRLHFSMDTYMHKNTMQTSMNISDARLATWALTKFMNLFKMNSIDSQVFFVAVFIALLAISGTLLALPFIKMLEKKTLKKIIVVSLCINLAFVNYYFVEFFTYPSYVVSWGMGILFASIAFYFITKGDKALYYVLSFLALNIAVSFYQYYIQYFLIYTILYILVKHKFILSKQSMKPIGLTFAIGLGATALNVLTMVLLKRAGLIASSYRSFSVSSMVDNVKIILLEVQRDVWVGLGIKFVPYWVTIVFVVSIVALIAYNAYKQKFTAKQNVVILLFGLYAYAVIFALFLVTNPIWATLRTLSGFYIFISALVLLLISIKTEQIKSVYLVLALSFFMAFQVYHIQGIAISQFETNAIDHEYAMIIGERIRSYEEEKGIEVTQIALVPDSNPTWSYQRIEYVYRDFNIRSYMVDWAKFDMINYVTGRNLQRIDMPEDIFEKYFEGKDWNYFMPEEQIVFIGDTVFIVTY